MKFPIKLYFEKPDFYEINRSTWWNATDKIIKLFQWILFIAVLDVAYSRTNSISIKIVEVFCAILVFKATVAFFTVAIRIEVDGIVKRGGIIYYMLSVVITLVLMSGLYILGRNFANDVFSAFVDFQKAR